MSTEGGGGNASSERSEEVVGEESVSSTPQKQSVKSEASSPPSDQGTEPSTPGDEVPGRTTSISKAEGTRESGIVEETEEGELKPAAKGDSSKPVEVATDSDTKPRQVIAVSASKGPAAFFNLARKFLVTDEMCDLSALEGAIVSAVDAAHLLERSKLATIVGYVYLRKINLVHQGLYRMTLSNFSLVRSCLLLQGSNSICDRRTEEEEVTDNNCRGCRETRTYSDEQASKQGYWYCRCSGASSHVR